jgi:putative redox protein
MRAKVLWDEAMAFEARLNGHTFMIDASSVVGGRDRGPRPKGLLLLALAGCTAMDVVSILKKYKVQPTSFEVDTDAELTSEHPKKFTRIKIIYRLEGDDLPLDRIRQAVQMSEEHFCGVSATLRPTVELTSEIWVNGERQGS